jgi:hypothetical protein
MFEARDQFVIGGYVAEERAIQLEGEDRFPASLLPSIPINAVAKKKAQEEEDWFRELRAMGL